METGFIEISNGEAVARDKIPHLPFETFHQEALKLVDAGGKVVQFFAYPDCEDLKLLAVLRTDKLLLAGTDAPPAYPALSAQAEPFHMFEREIAEQYGILPENHPWLKMVRYHPNYRGLPDIFGNDYAEDIPGRIGRAHV